MALQTAEERRSQRRDDARRVILEAAEEVLTERGYEGFSIRRLSERCGYTAPSIYHHFRDKRGLIEALLQQRFSELLQRMKRVSGHADPLESIRAQARAFLRFGLRHPKHYRLLATAREPGAEPVAAVEAVRRHFEQPWQELQSAGRLRVGAIETAQRTIWAQLHGLLSLRSMRPDLEWPVPMLEDAIDAVLRGLAEERGSNSSDVPTPRSVRGRAR